MILAAAFAVVAHASPSDAHGWSIGHVQLQTRASIVRDAEDRPVTVETDEHTVHTVYGLGAEPQARPAGALDGPPRGIAGSARRLGVSFASVRDPHVDTTSAHGCLLLQLLAVFASYERESIRERITAGVRRAQGAGRHVGRPRVVVPAEAAVPETTEPMAA